MKEQNKNPTILDIIEKLEGCEDNDVKKECYQLLIQGLEKQIEILDAALTKVDPENRCNNPPRVPEMSRPNQRGISIGPVFSFPVTKKFIKWLKRKN